MPTSAKRLWGFNLAAITLIFAVSLFAEQEQSDLTAFLKTLSHKGGATFHSFGHGRNNNKTNFRYHRADIESIGALTLGDILASFPGVFFGSTANGLPTLGLHGWVGMPRFLVLVDGIRINDPFDGLIDYSLPASFINYVDVYYGPSGTWFGEGSLLGVIHVVTIKEHSATVHQTVGFNKALSHSFLVNMKKRDVRLGIGLSHHALPMQKMLVDGSSGPFAEETVGTHARGFLEWQLSRQYGIHILNEGMINFSDWQSESVKNQIVGMKKWSAHYELRVQKRRKERKLIDVFAIFSGFNNGINLPQPSNKLLREDITSKRFTLGAKSHLSLWKKHDLYLGAGGSIQGIPKGGYELREGDDAFFEQAFLADPNSRHFIKSHGHLWAFVEDEWQVRSPFSAIFGARAVVPIEQQGEVSGEMMPNIAAVILPNPRLQFRLSLETSWRIPTFYEESHRAFEGWLIGKKPFKPRKQANERSKSIEASTRFSGEINNIETITSLAMQVSRVDGAIYPETEAKELKSSHEVDIFQARLLHEAKFMGGHRMSLGLTYNFAFKKNFDETGYPTCRISLLHFSDPGPRCPKDPGGPEFVGHAGVFYDLLSLGGLDFRGNFLADTKGNNQATSLMLTYTSKPVWQYVEFTAQAKGIGHLFTPRKKAPFLRSFNFAKGFNLFVGVRIGW